jgi:hypothetical protein
MIQMQKYDQKIEENSEREKGSKICTKYRQQIVLLYNGQSLSMQQQWGNSGNAMLMV